MAKRFVYPRRIDASGKSYDVLHGDGKEKALRLEGFASAMIDASGNDPTD
jgi:hypothetical protein